MDRIWGFQVEIVCNYAGCTMSGKLLFPFVHDFHSLTVLDLRLNLVLIFFLKNIKWYMYLVKAIGNL